MEIHHLHPGRSRNLSLCMAALKPLLDYVTSVVLKAAAQSAYLTQKLQTKVKNESP